FVLFSEGKGSAHIGPRGGAFVLPLTICSPLDEKAFMIAAVSTRGSSELTLERPVESSLRLIPDVAGDFCDTSRCRFKCSRGQLKPPARQVRHWWFGKISSEP